MVIFVAPSALWCVLAGAARMRLSVFLVCDFGGTMVRLLLFWYAADVLRDELDQVLEVIDDAQIPLLVLTIGLGFLQMRRQWRRASAAAVLTELEGDAGLALAEDLSER